MLFLPLRWLCLGIVLSLWACSDASQTNRKGLPGRVAHVQFNDSLLAFYTIVTQEDVDLSGASGDSWTRYSYEEAYLSGYVLGADSVRHLYQEQTPCARQDCGTHYIDQIVAMGARYLVFKCGCNKDFSVVEWATGREVFAEKKAAERYPELSQGIAQWQGQGKHLNIDAADGKRYMLDLDNLQLLPFAFDKNCPMPELRSSTGYALSSTTRYEFDSDAGDNRSFLVVRGIQTGTGQSYKYRRGEPWLHPSFLTAPGYCSKALQTPQGHLFVLHGSRWTPSLDTDRITQIEDQGNRLYTAELRDFGITDTRYCTLYPRGERLYVATRSELIVLDLKQGKPLNRFKYAEL